VGVDPGDLEQVLIGGAFGQYINIEKAIQLGLLPDLPWERFPVPRQHGGQGRVPMRCSAARRDGQVADGGGG
jgi:hypothetical protein